MRVLSAKAWSQTYITVDTWHNRNLQCVVKHFKPNGIHPKQWKFGKRLFERETEILRKLGNHSQIPRLLDSFEDDRGFYLVQELIVGNLLSEELPINPHCSRRWSEHQCIELLQDVLGILEFVHRQGVIHGDLKPNNLIRRSSDKRLVLIDFSAAYQIDPAQVQQRVIQTKFSQEVVTMPPLGYIPIEQLVGHPCPNSDLYALGTIAIQAITRLHPAELPTDPNTGEIRWQDRASVREAMAFVLNHMVLQDCQKRFQSATDALIVLKTLMMSSEEQQVSNKELSEGLVLEGAIVPATPKLFDLNWFKLPPLIAATGVGMAASNTLAISFGLYSLLHAAPANPGLDLLEQARIKYETGNFNEAIALAKSVPTNSSVYQESQATIAEWRQEWQKAATQFQAVEQALQEERWQDVLEEAQKTPNVTFWQQKIELLVEQAKPHLEVEAQKLLHQAYQRAAEKDFNGALLLLKKIPPDTTTGATIQPKLAEYQEKQRIKAEYLLQQAYNSASERDFKSALNYLSQIPQDTPTYETAQIKLAEYSQKQHFKEEAQRIVELAKVGQDSQQGATDPFNTKPFVINKRVERTSNLNPGSQLQEVIPKGVGNRE